eukprot:1110450-Rhodomonas_salina.1
MLGDSRYDQPVPAREGVAEKVDNVERGPNRTDTEAKPLGVDAAAFGQRMVHLDTARNQTQNPTRLVHFVWRLHLISPREIHRQ